MLRFCLLLMACASVPWTVAAQRPPNVVFILADDLGWSDTTLYGTTSLYRTPHIKRLAKRGMTFTRAYSSSPLCSPTRASILTGLSPARHGITTPRCHLPQVILAATATKTAAPQNKSTIPDSVSRLKTDYYTLGEAFHDAGYATGHFGKWHLGPEPYSPLQHGFDIDVPHWHGPGPAGSYVAPWKFKDFDHDPDVPDQHLEDRMATEAVAFLEQHQDKPFFLNYWMFSVHAPFDAKQALIEKYRSQVDPDNPQRCPTYAAMIESMDDAVGTLIDTLDRLKLSDNTIIVFASDNGGNMYNRVEGETPTSNAPLRGGKATMYEGGVRGPCCVIWPGQVKSDSRSDEIIQSSDFYPTLVEISKLTLPQQIPFDGVSIVPALQGGRLERDAIFTYFPHNPAVPDWLPPSVSVHRGDWKLIRIFHGGKTDQHRWKLFNLKSDIGETQNLAAKHPALVQELDALIESHLVQTQAVRPLANPNFDPTKHHPEREGIAFNRQAKPAKQTAQRTAGWLPSKDCSLAKKSGQLVVTSTGNDPYLSFNFPKPLETGSFKLNLTLTSNARGDAQLFWGERGADRPFFRERSKTFPIKNDGKPHQYTILMETQADLTAIRLDPSRGPGTIRIESIELKDQTDELIYRWPLK
ncbi:Arylsulfatase precursor [Stieleria bergensis]|uniref:Arylsulfatase n=1 Tax=Stieleria bergensis TaxID=2528025 RepID=A0A517T2W4_9BACT|nr:Arylsulfatase precursor [Planctomycetes bacterium SV_7m_r]